MANKAEKVQILLSKGMTTKEITERMAVSPSYIWTIKKKMAEEERNGRPCNNDCGPAVEATNVDAILNERGSRYGRFIEHALLTQLFKDTMNIYLKKHEKRLMPDQQEALDMIFHKIGRILNGDPNYVDSWVDIAGYAQLVADRLQGEER